MLRFIHFISRTAFEVPLQMIVALLLLMFMLRNTKLHKLWRTVFYLPLCVCSMTAVSIMWSMLLNTHYGMLPSAWKNRYHDAKHALEHDMGDAYGDFLLRCGKGSDIRLPSFRRRRSASLSRYMRRRRLTARPGCRNFSMSQNPAYGIRSVFAW